jgi:hypothetical protein
MDSALLDVEMNKSADGVAGRLHGRRTTPKASAEAPDEAVEAWWGLATEEAEKVEAVGLTRTES